MPSVNIISYENGGGLSRNICLLSQLLRAAGWHVNVVPLVLRDRNRSELVAGRCAASSWKVARNRVKHWWKFRRTFGVRHDVNLFMEWVMPEWFPKARFNCLVPNPEWFEPWWHEHLPHFDLVLCKTRHAQRIFADLGATTAFISFTSFDRRQGGVRRDEGAFFHLAGRSRLKGTLPLMELWRRHPEWPTLTVVQNPKHARPATAANIDLRHQYLADDELRELQNRHGVHVCPSETEGFGHYLIEAMSCQAVVITTNAPPMNEYVSPARGLLAECTATGRQRLATSYSVDVASLERQIEMAIRMTSERRAELGDNARRWFEANDSFFRGQIVAQLEQLVNSARQAA